MFRIFARISALILVVALIVSTVEASNTSRSITQNIIIQGPSIHVNIPQGKSHRRYKRHYKPHKRGKSYRHRNYNKGKFIDGHDASNGRWDGKGPGNNSGRRHRR